MAGSHTIGKKIVGAHCFAGRRHLASRGVALILAFGPPFAVLEACSDSDSSRVPESRTSHVGKGEQPGKGQSEGGDSSAENESPPDEAAPNGEQSVDKSDGTTASDGSSGGVSATLSSPSTGGGSTLGGDKTAGTDAPSLNSPTKMEGWKAGQANSDKILSKSKRGYFLSVGRQRAEGAQGGKRKTTEDAVNRHLTESQQDRSSLHAEPSGKAESRGANGARVDGVTNVMTYTDAGGKSYRGRHQLRAFSASMPVAHVLVSYTYPTFAYSESELTKTIEKNGLSVDGGVPGGVVD